jgi:hypothetical protein
VLVWAMIFVVVTAGLIISHTTYMASNRRSMDVRLRRSPLATSFARSGLTDATTWFQNQPTQPVLSFAPQYAPTAEPPVIDTVDAAVGLVRDFEIRGSLWGRYEVRHDDVRDISRERGLVSSGQVWELSARGYVYRVVDPTKAFDQKPNEIVSMTRLTNEIRGVPMNPPAPAAVCIDDPWDLTLDPGAVVDGRGQPAVSFPPGGLLPFLLGLLLAPKPGYDATPNAVFGMTLDELKDVSDLVLSDGRLPDELVLGTPRVLFAPGDLTFDPTTVVNGNVMLVVGDDLTIADDNRSRLTGLIWVGDDANIGDNFQFDGTLIVRGDLHLGSGSRIRYDAGVLTALRRDIARYRLRRTFRPPPDDEDDGR